MMNLIVYHVKWLLTFPCHVT